MNSKVVVILGILAAAGVVGAVVVSRSRSPQRAEIGEGLDRRVLLPTLAQRAGDIAQITVTRATGTVTVVNQDGQWRVREKGDYPAKLESVRGVVVGLTDLREVERKTSRPEQFDKLGVQDPVPAAAAGQPGANGEESQSTLVTLSDKEGKSIASIILGNIKPGMTPEVYVRRVGENQSWLAAGRVDVPREATGWMDTKLADIRRERVRSVSVTHADGSSVVVSRAQQNDAMALQNIPAGKEIKDPGSTESIAGTLNGLMFQDVMALASLDPAAPTEGQTPGPRIEVRTFDGLVVNIVSVTHLGRSWWKMSASVDESVLATLPPTQPTPQTGESAAVAPAAATQEGVRAEAAGLNAAWSTHVFAPSDWKVRTLNMTMAELVKDVAPPAAEPASPGASPSPGEPEFGRPPQG